MAEVRCEVPGLEYTVPLPRRRGARRSVAVLLSPAGGYAGKYCRECASMRPLEAFNTNAKVARSWSGRDARCRECRSRAYWALPEHVRAESKRKASCSALRSKYGVDTPGWYEERFTAQRGLCAICSRPQQRQKSKGNSWRQRLSVHHDHLTGRKVALVCGECNFILEYEWKTPGLCAKVEAWVRDEILRAGRLTG